MIKDVGQAAKKGLVISNRRLRQLGSLAASAFVCYVGINIAMVNLVPLLQHVVLHVEVVAGESSEPVAGATVGWAAIPPHLAPRSLGKTGPLGSLEITDTFQENPCWVLPRIGTFKFRNRILEVGADGFRTETISLADALPSLPYSTPKGHVRVRLRPK